MQKFIDFYKAWVDFCKKQLKNFIKEEILRLNFKSQLKISTIFLENLRYKIETKFTLNTSKNHPLSKWNRNLSTNACDDISLKGLGIFIEQKFRKKDISKITHTTQYIIAVNFQSERLESLTLSLGCWIFF